MLSGGDYQQLGTFRKHGHPCGVLYFFIVVMAFCTCGNSDSKMGVGPWEFRVTRRVMKMIILRWRKKHPLEEREEQGEQALSI